MRLDEIKEIKSKMLVDEIEIWFNLNLASRIRGQINCKVL